LLSFLFRRTLSSILVLISVAALVYIVFFNFPIDPVELICDRYCTPELVNEIRNSLQLNGTAFYQLLKFLIGLVLGRELYPDTAVAFYCEAPCLGFSFRTNASVTELILDRIPATISLAIGALLVASVVGFLVAFLSVLYLNSWLDRFLQSSTMILASIQVYFAGVVLQYFLVFRWGVLPQSGYTSVIENPISWLSGLVLPWLTLGMSLSGIYARLLRAKFQDLMTADFVRTAKSVGYSNWKLIAQTLLRPSLGPAVAAFGIMFGELLGGTVLTELVFNIPGLGRLTADAIEFLDLPLLVGVILFSAFAVVVGNLIADILHYRLDPRVELN